MNKKQAHIQGAAETALSAKKLSAKKSDQPVFSVDSIVVARSIHNGELHPHSFLLNFQLLLLYANCTVHRLWKTPTEDETLDWVFLLL